MTEVIIEILNHLLFCMFDKTCICVVTYNVNNLNIASHRLSLRSSRLWLGNIASKKTNLHEACLHQMSQNCLNSHHTGEPPWHRLYFAWDMCDYRNKKEREENIAGYYQPCCISRHFLSTKLLTIRCFTRKSNALLSKVRCKPVTANAKVQTLICGLRFPIENPGAKGL